VTVETVPAVIEVPGMRLTRADGTRLSFAPDPGADGGAARTPRHAVRRLIEHLPVTGIRAEEPDLEDVARQASRAGR
jgi:hypothetical protein